MNQTKSALVTSLIFLCGSGVIAEQNEGDAQNGPLQIRQLSVDDELDEAKPVRGFVQRIRIHNDGQILLNDLQIDQGRGFKQGLKQRDREDPRHRTTLFGAVSRERTTAERRFRFWNRVPYWPEDAPAR